MPKKDSTFLKEFTKFFIGRSLRQLLTLIN